MERDNEIYQRLESTTLPSQVKKGLIIGGVLILVISIITTIAVVLSNQEPLTLEGKYSATYLPTKVSYEIFRLCVWDCSN